MYKDYPSGEAVLQLKRKNSFLFTYSLHVVSRADYARVVVCFCSTYCSSSSWLCCCVMRQWAAKMFRFFEVTQAQTQRLIADSWVRRDFFGLSALITTSAQRDGRRHQALSCSTGDETTASTIKRQLRRLLR